MSSLYDDKDSLVREVKKEYGPFFFTYTPMAFSLIFQIHNGIRITDIIHLLRWGHNTLLISMQ